MKLMRLCFLDIITNKQSIEKIKMIFFMQINRMSPLITWTLSQLMRYQKPSMNTKAVCIFFITFVDLKKNLIIDILFIMANICYFLNVWNLT